MATKDLIRRFLLERMALRAIARATGVSRSWLQKFVNGVDRDQAPHEPGAAEKSVRRADRRVRRTLEFRGLEGRSVVGLGRVGGREPPRRGHGRRDRSEQTARRFGEALFQEYRDGAIFGADFRAAYAAVIPPERHAADEARG